MRFCKQANPFLELIRCYQVPPPREVGITAPTVNVTQQSAGGGVNPSVKVTVSDVIIHPSPQPTLKPPSQPSPHHSPLAPPSFRKAKDSSNTPPLLPLPHADELFALVGGAAVAGELLLESGEIGRPAEEVSAQTGKVLPGRIVESSLISSLGVLLNKAFSGPALSNLMNILVNKGLQFQAPAQGLASAETLLQNQSPLQTRSGEIHSSEIKAFVESVAHQVSLALSIAISHGIQLNPAQALALALAHSLNLSSEQATKLLGEIHAAHLSAKTAEQARLVNPFIQGMVLNDPSAMKGFMAQLFSPVLKSLMGLLFTKELPFSYFPSNLLTELGGLMARSAQRKRNRPQRKKIRKSDRVSRKGSIYVEVDLEDEGFEPEEETDWWERFYRPDETYTFFWS